MLQELILCIVVQLTQQNNLIHQGTLQNLDLSPTSTLYSDRGYYVWRCTSNYWYKETLGSLQIKVSDSYVTTHAIQINSAILVCQAITLQKNSKYLLTYDAFVANVLQKVTVQVFANKELISEIYIPTSLTFKSYSGFFYAKQQDNQICFNQSHFPPDYWTRQGIMLDNVTIQKVNQHFILLQYLVLQQIGQVKIQTNITDEKVIKQFIYSYNIQIGSIFFGLYYQQSQQEQDKSPYFLYFTPNISLNIEDVRMFLKNDNILTEVTIIEENKQKRFIKIDQNDQKVIQNIKSGFQDAKQVIYLAMNYFKTLFFSYLILDLITYWNLSLFYYFIGFKAMPQFCKQIYELFISTHFRQISLSRMFPGQIFQKFDSYIQSIAIPGEEYIQKYKKEMKWFGSFGFSSKTAESIKDNFFILIFLALKLFFMFLVYLLVPKKLQSKIKVSKLYALLICGQIVGLTPELLVSAGQGLTHGSEDIIEKSCKLISLILSLICIASVFIMPVIEILNSTQELRQYNKAYINYRVNKLDSKQEIDKSQKVSELIRRLFHEGRKKRNKRASKLYKFRLLDSSLIVFIPIMVLYTDQFGAIVFIWIHMLLKNYLLLKAYSQLQKTEKAKHMLMSTVWLLHHLCFTALFYFSDSYPYIQNQAQQNLIVWIGILCILTVILGGLIQLVISIVEIIVSAIQGIRMIKYTFYSYKEPEENSQLINKDEQKCAADKITYQISPYKHSNYQEKKECKQKVIFDIQILEQQPQRNRNHQKSQKIKIDLNKLQNRSSSEHQKQCIKSQKEDNLNYYILLQKQKKMKQEVLEI